MNDRIDKISIFMNKKFIALAICVGFLSACSDKNPMGWTQSDEDLAYETCELMRIPPLPDDYCSCTINRLASEMQKDDVERIGIQLIENGWDFSQIQGETGSTYKDIIKSCIN